MDRQRLQGRREETAGSTSGRLGSLELTEVLDDAAGPLLERHLEQSKEWFPHELVPWELGKRCVAGQAPRPPDDPLPEGVRSALFVNLLTEDNLPHYFAALADAFRSCSTLGEWSRRWAAEEQRHAIVLRDWISVTRHLDLVGLERARMRQLTAGFEPGVRARGLIDGVVYLALQELATRVAHRNTGLAIEDPTGRAMLSQVAADENLHFLFYKDMAAAAFELDPDAMVQAASRVVRDFAMPGTGVPGFKRHAMAIAAAGIFDFAIFHDNVLAPVVTRHWRIDKLTGLSTDAEQARDALFAHMDQVRRTGERFAELRGDRTPATAGR
jgi:acyl-[acyl-carrier-protein] desaturase